MKRLCTSVAILALSAGLAAIWPLGRAARPRRTSAWPVVAAAALATLGSFLAVRQTVAFDGAQIGIAIVLVVAGAALILRRAISAKVSGRSAA